MSLVCMHPLKSENFEDLISLKLEWFSNITNDVHRTLESCLIKYHIEERILMLEHFNLKFLNLLLTDLFYDSSKERQDFNTYDIIESVMSCLQSFYWWHLSFDVLTFTIGITTYYLGVCRYFRAGLYLFLVSLTRSLFSRVFHSCMSWILLIML